MSWPPVALSAPAGALASRANGFAALPPAHRLRSVVCAGHLALDATLVGAPGRLRLGGYRRG
jgi:hypothetical protein